MATKLLRVEEAAEQLSLGRTMVYRLLAKGELESVRIGKSRRIPADAVDAYVHRLRGDAGDDSPPAA